MSYTGSITENRISVGLPPPLRDWLARDARTLGMTVPALIRHRMMKLWEDETKERPAEAMWKGPRG